MQQPSTERVYNETAVVFLMAAVQFVNVLEFMIVMPLTPVLSKALSIPLPHMGPIVGSYMFASAVAGLVGMLFLDRFERKKALLWALLGLFVANSLCIIAIDETSLLLARVASGIFGGPVLSLALAMVADCIAPQRRGWAIGRVLSGFAVASVVGVPLGLELAVRFNWQAPFMMTSGLILIMFLIGIKVLPAKTNILAQVPWREGLHNLWTLFRQRKIQMVCAYHGIGTAASFILIPNIAAHVQHNLHLPISYMSILYTFGGIASFLSLHFVGKGIDALGTMPMMIGASLLFSLTVLTGFVWYDALSSIPVLLFTVLLFVCFMTAASARNVCAQTLTSQIAPPQQRAAMMAISSAATNGSSAIAAAYAGYHLTELPDGRILGLPILGMLSVICALTAPLVMGWVVRQHRTQ